MSRCQDCESKLGNQGDWITCGYCKSKYCFKCGGLKTSTWKSMNDAKKLEWKCKQKCRTQRTHSETSEKNGTVTETHSDKVMEEDDNTDEDEDKKGEEEIRESDVKQYRTRIEKKLDLLILKYDTQNNKLEEVIKTLEFVAKDNIELKQENKDMKKTMQELEIRIQELENKEERTKVLEKKMNTMFIENKDKEQYDRNRNLEIGQLDWLTNENLPQVISELAKNFNIQHNDNEIETAHRIPNRNKEKPSVIIIQFKNRNYRDKWLQQRKRIVTNDNMYRNGNRKRIYLNENMTPYTKSLFWKTREFARQFDYKYVWFRNGKIMMRKDGDTQTVNIVHEEDDLIKLTPRQNS
jgi:hypothetical protein